MPFSYSHCLHLIDFWVSIYVQKWPEKVLSRNALKTRLFGMQKICIQFFLQTLLARTDIAYFSVRWAHAHTHTILGLLV